MKKILILLSLMVVLIVSACSQTEDNANKADNNEDEATNSTENAAAEKDETELKASVLRNYLNVAKSLRLNQKEINTYLGELANPDAETATLETLKSDAITAAEEAASTVESFTLENLDEDTTAKFEEALLDIKGAYDEYATALATEEVDVAPAEAKIAAANEKITMIFEEVGLRAPNLSNEIN